MTELSLDKGDWIALVSAAIALISLVANFLVVRRQLVLQREEIRTALDAETARWCAEVLSAFGEAAAWLDARAGGTDQAPPRDALRVAEKLSAAADLGRLYFPNVDPRRHGKDKAAAFRGHRQPAIDAILVAHDLMREAQKLGPSDCEPATALLFDSRRLLISEVHLATDPRRLSLLMPRGAQTLRAIRRDETRRVEPLLTRLQTLPVTPRSFSESQKL